MHLFEFPRIQLKMEMWICISWRMSCLPRLKRTTSGELILSHWRLLEMSQSRLKYFKNVFLENLMFSWSHSDYIGSVFLATAHPHEEKDGTVLNLGSSVERGLMYYNVIQIPKPKTLPDGTYVSAHQQAKVIAKVQAHSSVRPGYFHSFGMTER